MVFYFRFRNQSRVLISRRHCAATEGHLAANLVTKFLRPFLGETLEAARRFPLRPKFEPVETGLALVEVFDVTYSGHGGQPIKAWLLVPRNAAGRPPCVVEFVGYGGGRSLPIERLL